MLANFQLQHFQHVSQISNAALRRLILTLCTLYNQRVAQLPKKSNIPNTVFEIVNAVLQVLMIGQQTSDYLLLQSYEDTGNVCNDQYELYITWLTGFFIKNCKQFGDVIQLYISQIPDFKQMLLAKITDVPKLNALFLANALRLRNGQFISFERWRNEVHHDYKETV